MDSLGFFKTRGLFLGAFLFGCMACGPDLSKFGQKRAYQPGELLITLDGNKWSQLSQRGSSFNLTTRESLSEEGQHLRESFKYSQTILPPTKPDGSSYEDGQAVIKITLPDGVSLEQMQQKLSGIEGVESIDYNWLHWPASRGENLNFGLTEFANNNKNDNNTPGNQVDVKDIKFRYMGTGKGVTWDFDAQKIGPENYHEVLDAVPHYIPNDPFFKSHQFFYMYLTRVTQVWHAAYKTFGHLAVPPEGSDYGNIINGSSEDRVHLPKDKKQQPNVVVAVIDNGFDISHPDLNGRWLVYDKEVGEGCGWTPETNVIPNVDACANGVDDDQNGIIDDFVGLHAYNNGGAPTPYDEDPKNSHGTHVAGIIGAIHNNRMGIAGVCPTCFILPINGAELKPSSSGGFAAALPDDLIMKGMDYISARQNARATDIVNLSIGVYRFSRPYMLAISRVARESLVVAAASNEDSDRLSYPAALPDVMAVGAVGGVGDTGNSGTPSKTVKKQGNSIDASFYPEKAFYSNFGNHIALLAPGTSIYSTIPGANYAYDTGTSQAAPMAAGIAGLVLYLERQSLRFLGDGADFPEGFMKHLINTADGSILHGMYPKTTEKGTVYECDEKQIEKNIIYQSNKGYNEGNKCQMSPGHQYLGAGLINAAYALSGYTLESVEISTTVRRFSESGCLFGAAFINTPSAPEEPGTALLVVSFLLILLTWFLLKEKKI